MRAGWNEVLPAALPGLTPGERLRLTLRGAWAFLALVVLFAIFLPLRGVDVVAERLAGRPVTRLGARIVRLWAAQALPSLGLSYRQRGTPMRGGGAFVANHSSWIDIVALQRAAAPFLVSKAEVREWPVVGHIGRAIGTMFIDRRPGEAKRQEAALLARLAKGDQMALFPEGTSTDGMRVLPFKSTLFSAFFAPGLEDGIAVQPVTIAYRVRRRPAAELLRLVGGDGVRGPRPRRAGAVDRRGGRADLPPAAAARRLRRPQGAGAGGRRGGAGRAGGGKQAHCDASYALRPIELGIRG